MNWGVVIAAGGLVEDPLASAIGTPRKALATIAGRTSLERTLSAVEAAGFEKCVTVSGDDVAPYVCFGQLVLERDSQIENARAAVESLEGVDAVLFLPADTPLIEPPMITQFVEAVKLRRDPQAERWLAAGLTTLKEFQEIFPRMSTHPLNLKDGAFLSGALYAASPQAFNQALGLLEQMSKSRKSQLKMVFKLGLGTVVKYLTHQISLKEAEERLARFFDGQTIIVTGCHPLTVADIDDIADYDEIKIYASFSKEPLSQ